MCIVTLNPFRQHVRCQLICLRSIKSDWLKTLSPCDTLSGQKRSYSEQLGEQDDDGADPWCGGTQLQEDEPEPESLQQNETSIAASPSDENTEQQGTAADAESEEDLSVYYCCR